MTPQLQQAIKLLQLSTLDLQQEIQQALDTNPMLEVKEEEIEPIQQNNSEAPEAPNSDVKQDDSTTELQVPEPIPDD